MKHMIAAIQLLFIGKVFRNSSDQLPTQLLTACSNNKRRPGGVLFTNRRSIANSLKLVLPGIVNKIGLLKSLGFYAIDEKIWTDLINQFKCNKEKLVPLTGLPPSNLQETLPQNNSNTNTPPPPSPPRQRSTAEEMKIISLTL